LALYCFLCHPDDYRKTVLRGANTNGDSGSIACIAGAVSGGRLGAEAMPKEWFMRIEKADQLAVVAERLRLKKGELDGR
ncbi:MAG: ADP-ribosylglycohydrolase family protein, partial [Desulfatiglandaceae bacterium]